MGKDKGSNLSSNLTDINKLILEDLRAIAVNEEIRIMGYFKQTILRFFNKKKRIELWGKVLEYQKIHGFGRAGICFLIFNMLRVDIIKNSEYDILMHDLLLNKPKGVREIYWWVKGDEESRINFIKDRING